MRIDTLIMKNGKRKGENAYNVKKSKLNLPVLSKIVNFCNDKT